MNYTTTGTKVYKVVLTGGPCGGKTSGQARISIFFENLGWKVYRVPETAGILLGGGVKFSEFNKEQAFQFQSNLMKTLMSVEQTFFDLAKSCDRNCLVICDRGVMDGSAYIKGDEWERMKEMNGWNEVDIRDNRYNQVIHLVSAAIGAEAFYTREDSQVRSEGIEAAKVLDGLTSQAWVGHPYYDVIDNENSENFDNKLNRVLQAICTRLGIDAADRLAPASKKRKFLLKSLPPPSVFPQFQDFTVIHDYLVTPSRKTQARLRKRGKNDIWTYTHTIRRPEINQECVELKMVHTARDYLVLLAQVDETHFTIYKTRRCFLWENQYFQMDIYEQPCHPRCKDLVILETYTSVQDKPIKLPPFLDISMEVTDDLAYSMYNLSRRDEWTELRLLEESSILFDDD